jgi:DNA repair exonuclease SbcCD ATPase subunit
MAKKKQEKRKFIEDIFNLGIFSNMLSCLKDDITEKKKSFDVETTRFDEAQKTLLSYERQRDSAVEERTRKLEKYIQRQTNNIDELKQVNDKLSTYVSQNNDVLHQTISDLETAYSRLDSSLQDQRNKRSEKTLLIQQLSKQIQSIGTEKDKCPVCLRSMEEHDKDYIESEKQRIRTEAELYAEDIKSILIEETKHTDKQKKINEKIKEIRTSIHSYELQQQEKQNLTQRVEQLKQWLEMLEHDILELKQSGQTVDTAVDQQKTKIESLKADIEHIKQSLNMLDIVKFVVSEEGVKSYVVKKILKLFNTKLNYYLKKMDANCIVSFNEYFEEEIVDTKGKPCSYFNFSGAERKNIDLACLFTFIDMRRLQGDVCFNFSIYDELFDSSLDERGVELVISLLKERVDKFKESIMVISHRKESIKAATGEVIFLEKNNGITKRVDFKEYSA